MLVTLVVMVLSAAPGDAASVEFAPPLAKDAARAMAGMPGAEEQCSLLALLRALEGVDVQVTLLDGSATRGRVLEVSDDEKRPDKDGKPVDEPMLISQP